MQKEDWSQGFSTHYVHFHCIPFSEHCPCPHSYLVLSRYTLFFALFLGVRGTVTALTWEESWFLNKFLSNPSFLRPSFTSTSRDVQGRNSSAYRSSTIKLNCLLRSPLLTCYSVFSILLNHLPLVHLLSAKISLLWVFSSSLWVYCLYF